MTAQIKLLKHVWYLVIRISIIKNRRICNGITITLHLFGDNTWIEPWICIIYFTTTWLIYVFLHMNKTMNMYYIFYNNMINIRVICSKLIIPLILYIYIYILWGYIYFEAFCVGGGIKTGWTKLGPMVWRRNGKVNLVKVTLVGQFFCLKWVWVNPMGYFAYV